MFSVGSRIKRKEPSCKRKALEKQKNQSAAFDLAAAEYPASLVEHHRLSRGDGPLGLIKYHLHPSVCQRGEQGCCRFCRIADLGGDPHRFGEGFHLDEVHFPGSEGAPEQSLAGSEGNGVLLRVDAADEHPLSEADAQSSALSDGVPPDPFMGAQHLAVPVDETALGRLLTGIAAEEGGKIPIGNKADILAVLFGKDRKPGLPCHLPDLLLTVGIEGQHHPGKLLLGQRPQHIALVLAVIVPHGQMPAPICRIVVHPSIVTGGDIVIAQFLRLIGKGGKLDGAVAVHTGVGGESMTVILHKALHYLLAELLAEIHHEVGNPQHPADFGGVPDIVLGTAGTVLAVPQLKGESRYLMALIPED